MKKKIFWWTLVVLWCCIIFYQSDKPAAISGMESNGITDALNNFIGNLLGPKYLVFSDHFIRKSGHFFEYFILGYLTFKGFYSSTSNRKAAWYACIFSIAYSITDEIHQYFIPGRALMITDVLLDSVGIISGVMVIYFYQRGKSKKANLNIY